jgi:MFS family permease
VLLPAALSAVAQYANWAATFGFLPILARQLGMSDVGQSLLISLNLAISAVGNLTAVAGASRIGPHRLMYGSFILLAAGLGVAALASSPAYLVVAQLCIGLSMGVGYPVLMGMSVRHVAEGERTTATGLYQAVYGIGMFTGPGASGLIARLIGIQPMFALTATVILGLGTLGTRILMAGRSE